jgi:glutamyl-Q tRNA(Asp) synthetase
MANALIYRGRFAPSPTGPLHMGSLLAAVASYLDARAAKGRWLLRIEDIDPPREVPGAADSIRVTLEAHGLHWDEEVLYQSTRSAAYEAALEQLHSAGAVFRCSCTRTTLGPGGSCGARCQPQPNDCCALRLRLDDRDSGRFSDRFAGSQAQRPQQQDIVLRRKDGLFAYALAVVVDDAAQAITDVVRGNDLLSQTPVQLQLFGLLGLSAPRYAHLPILADASGAKLSKQTGAAAIDNRSAMENLRCVLGYLGQSSADFPAGSPAELLHAATAKWNINSLRGNSAASMVYPRPSNT